MEAVKKINREKEKLDQIASANHNSSQNPEQGNFYEVYGNGNTEKMASKTLKPLQKSQGPPQLGPPPMKRYQQKQKNVLYNFNSKYRKIRNIPLEQAKLNSNLILVLNSNKTPKKVNVSSQGVGQKEMSQSLHPGDRKSLKPGSRNSASKQTKGKQSLKKVKTKTEENLQERLNQTLKTNKRQNSGNFDKSQVEESEEYTDIQYEKSMINISNANSTFVSQNEEKKSNIISDQKAHKGSRMNKNLYQNSVTETEFSNIVFKRKAKSNLRNVASKQSLAHEDGSSPSIRVSKRKPKLALQTMGNNSEASSPIKEPARRQLKGKNGVKSPLGQPFQVKNRINHSKQPPLLGTGVKSPTLREFSTKHVQKQRYSRPPHMRPRCGTDGKNEDPNQKDAKLTIPLNKKSHRRSSTKNLMKKRSSVKPSEFKTQLIKNDSTPHRDTTPEQTAQGGSGGKVQGKVGRKKVMKLEDLEIIETIGRGAFGDVKLVEHQETKKPYAMKILSKEDIINDKAIEQIKNEKYILQLVSQNSESKIDQALDGSASPEPVKVMRKLKSKNSQAQLALASKGNSNLQQFVSLVETLQDEENLYFVMEFIPGGQLHTRIRKQGSLDSDEVKFYMTEILMSLEYLHSKSIIYRDLKPENVMIDKDGHTRLVDFGFAKKLKVTGKKDSMKTFTQCGTPGYVAPEMLVKNLGHDFGVDIWTLGIILCEMIGGFTPFYDENPVIMYEHIQSCNIKWPKNISLIQRDLMAKILIVDPLQRPDIDEIKRHVMFKGTIWKKVVKRETTPPYVPDLDGPLDTKHFKKRDKKEEVFGGQAFKGMKPNLIGMLLAAAGGGDEQKAPTAKFLQDEEPQQQAGAHIDGEVMTLLKPRSNNTNLNSPEPAKAKNKYLEFPGAEIQAEYYGGYTSNKKPKTFKPLGDFKMYRINNIFEDF